jgi:hypothetical protein
LKLRWDTDVFSAYDSSERRIAPRRNPAQVIEGEVCLVGDQRTSLRSMLRRYAQLGKPFLLGLAHEGVPIVEQGTLFVKPTRNDLEWMTGGQKVMIVPIDEDVEPQVVTILSVTNDGYVEVDESTAATAKRGANLVPVVSVLLEPRQSFDRFPVNAEVWHVTARRADFGWTHAATLDLSTLDVTSNLQGITFTSRVSGDQGNLIEMTLTDEEDPVDPFLDEANNESIANVKDSATTLGELAELYETSLYVRMSGTYDPSYVIAHGDDMFSHASLTGGGVIDTGELTASVDTFENIPVWDRLLQTSDDQVVDSIHALTEILDLGGVPAIIGPSIAPAWGRQIILARHDMNEYLWLRKFLQTVRGQQVAFLVPTWREDLRASGDADGSTTLVIEAAFGEFTTWYSASYSYLQILQGSTVSYLYIESYEQTSPTEISLTVRGDLPSGPIDMISWMELCRFETEEFVITFENHNFSFDANARVVLR